MSNSSLMPDFIFESSWEVCNKVGGIYTVLSTRALTLQKLFPDNVFFIGPDCWKDKENIYFTEDPNLFAVWKEHAALFDELQIRIGRWNIPGNPIVFLVNFEPFYAHKNDIYSAMWNDFQVDSLHAYGDYDEASMFSFAAAKVVESFYHFFHLENKKVVYQGNEWMCGLGLLYIKKHLPQVATIFTTHATSIGRSIAGNNKALYKYLKEYSGDVMANELNMQSKHSIEKQTALHVDCFTTVSEITAIECAELLDKPVDMVLPNGFESDFVPRGTDFTKKRKAAKKRMLEVAEALTGKQYPEDTLILSTSGRYEFRNKGIDLFVETINRLKHHPGLEKPILAFIYVPAWMFAPRQDLIERLSTGKRSDTPLQQPVITHWLHRMDEDNVMRMMQYLGINNEQNDKVHLIFVPCYLTGEDGVFNLSYYDLILGNDLCIYPSYYEPWGYTPLEAIAFRVPCITTNLAGFGLWANEVYGRNAELEDGVKVIKRFDFDFNEVAERLTQSVLDFAAMDRQTVEKCRKKAATLSQKAHWDKFIKYYLEAYHFALSKSNDDNK